MRFATLILMTAAFGFGAAPDFTGEWKLNSSKSDFGQFPAPSTLTQKVTHAEPKLTVEMKMASDMGDFNTTSNYTTDGKESTNQGFGGGETKSTAKWEGDALSIETKGSFGDNSFTMKDKWTLSADGKMLTILRHFSSGMGDMDQKIVLDKQ